MKTLVVTDQMIESVLAAFIEEMDDMPPVLQDFHEHLINCEREEILDGLYCECSGRIYHNDWGRSASLVTSLYSAHRDRVTEIGLRLLAPEICEDTIWAMNTTLGLQDQELVLDCECDSVTHLQCTQSGARLHVECDACHMVSNRVYLNKSGLSAHIIQYQGRISRSQLEACFNLCELISRKVKRKVIVSFFTKFWKG